MQNIFNILKTNSGAISQLSQLVKIINPDLDSETDPKSKQIKKIRLPTKNDLIIMLQTEEEIRSSHEYISKCNEVASEPNGWLRISNEYQYKIARDNGFESEIEADIAVNHMRRAHILYPDEALFKSIPVYVRNNLASAGKYKVGDVVPNITIHHMSDTNPEVKLYSVLEADKMNLLIASSHT
jgi:hypothetical protein